MKSITLILLSVLCCSVLRAEPTKLRVVALQATTEEIANMLRLHVPDSELLAEDLELAAKDVASKQATQIVAAFSPEQVSTLLESLGDRAKRVETPNDELPFPVHARSSDDGSFIEVTFGENDEPPWGATTHSNFSLLLAFPITTDQQFVRLYLISAEA